MAITVNIVLSEKWQGKFSVGSDTSNGRVILYEWHWRQFKHWRLCMNIKRLRGH